MLTPCQMMVKSEGYAALDKALFTTPKRAAKFIPLLCDNCPTEAKADCASRAKSIVTPAGVIEPEGTFGGVFYG